MKTLVFQGDSITDCGRSSCGGAGYPKLDIGPGYAGLIASYLWGEYPGKWNILNRGISGDRIVDLYARWRRDLLNLKPDLVSMLIGVNDLGHENHQDGVEPERFDEFYRRLIDWTRKENPSVQFLLMEPFIFRHENVADWFHDGMKERQEIVRKIAEEYHFPFVPLQSIFDEAVRSSGSVGHWTADGIHPMPAGHHLIAKAWLSAAKKAGFPA